METTSVGSVERHGAVIAPRYRAAATRALLARVRESYRESSDRRRFERALACASGHERLDLLAVARRDRA